jgi:serine phosphatase RsbU (regulator of sigma subunit)
MIVGALLLSLNLDAQQRSVYNEQRAAAQRVARDIGRYISEIRAALDSYSLQVRTNIPRSRLIVLAQNVQTQNFPSLIRLSVIQRDGQELLRVERLQSISEADLQNLSADPDVDGALRFGQISYSTIRPNPDGKLSFLLTLPIRNDAGAVSGALRAEIAADPITEELRSIQAQSEGYAYLVNRGDNTILSNQGEAGMLAPAPLVRLLAERRETAEYIGTRNQNVVGALVPVVVSERTEQTGWLVVAEQPASAAFINVRRSALLLTGLIAVVGLMALIWALMQARHFLAPIDALRGGAAALGAGRLDHRITNISQDELGDVARAFNTMATHLQESLAEIAKQNDRLRRGLTLARDIQIGLLPDRPPWSNDTIAVFARSIPAYEVGGDFYTYLALSEGRVAIAIGDISGKGVGAALLMALTSSAVESQGRELEHPAQVLEALNQLLAPRLKANHMNAALLFAVFDPQQATLRVANAGMIAPVLISHRGNQFLDVGGLPVGALLGARYQEVEVQLDPHDTLLLLSDGVVEAHNLESELFGFDRLESTIASVSPGDVRALVELILAEVYEHMGGAEQHDDITIVAVQPQLAAVTRQTDQEQAIDYATL